MKIAFVTRELPTSSRCGGIGHYVWDIAKKLVSGGHDVVIIRASDDLNTYSDNFIEDVRVISLPGADYYIGGNKLFSALYSKLRKYTAYISYRKNVADCLDALIDENEVEIVEFAEYGNESLVWQHRLRRVPMIIRLHGPSILNRKTSRLLNVFLHPIRFIFGKLEIASLTNSDMITSASAEMLHFFERYLKLNFKDCQVIHNFVNFEDWSSPITDKGPMSKIKVFSAGSVTEGKGFRELYDACKELRGDGLDIELAIAGKLGKLGRKLQKYTLGADHNWLSILGPVSRKKLKSYYNTSDISCFPSWWEPFGLVCIEAMASGALVIGSRNGGMVEIINDGYDGYLVEPKNVLQLKRKILEISRLSPKVIYQIKVNAQKKAASIFGCNEIINKQLSLYNEVIERFGVCK